MATALIFGAAFVITVAVSVVLALVPALVQLRDLWFAPGFAIAGRIEDSFGHLAPEWSGVFAVALGWLFWFAVLSVSTLLLRHFLCIHTRLTPRWSGQPASVAGGFPPRYALRLPLNANVGRHQVCRSRGV